jgi:membrane-bound ClpP family serine protease
MNDAALWSSLLLLIGLVLLIVEFFVPSAGVIGFTAVGCLVGSLIIGFLGGSTLGLVMLVVNTITVPLALWGAFKVWPHTPIGRRMLVSDEELKRISNPTSNETLEALVGRVAIADMDLLPNGTIRIDDRRIDAVAVGGVIEAGQAVEIFSVDGARVRVRPTPRQAEPMIGPTANAPESALDQPIDTLGFDSLEDPLR